MVRVIDNKLYIAQGDDVAVRVVPYFEDLRYKQEYVLGVDDYYLVSIRYEADDYAPILYEVKLTSKILRIDSDTTKGFPVGKYSMSVFLYRKLSDGTMFRQQIIPNYKYDKLPTGRIINYGNFIVNAISDYK